jgi:hypothetical protein
VARTSAKNGGKLAILMETSKDRDDSEHNDGITWLSPPKYGHME